MTTRLRTPQCGPLAVFKWPLLLSAATAAGLTMALLGDGAWDALSWALLALPVGCCIWALLPRGAKPEA